MTTAKSITVPALPLFQHAVSHANSPAVHSQSSTYTYAQLLTDASHLRLVLLSHSPDPSDLHEARVLFLVPPSYEHVYTSYAVMMAGGVSVPLHPGHAEQEIAYLADDSNAIIALAHPDYAARIEPLARRLRIPFLTIPAVQPVSSTPLPPVQSLPMSPSRRALIIYTSGTTGRAKGVVSTHAMLEAQVTALTTAWEWTSADHILHVLPLHHVHGVVNVLLCPLYTGAQVSFLPGRFDARAVWEAFDRLPLTLFMAVPTIYSRLIAAFDAASEDEQRRWKAACGKFRLMVSGSAALPSPTLRRWREISGHLLLERYGMTELGMALSNPLHGQRKEGFVGRPLPGVLTKLRPGDPPTADEGELLVKGPNVFSEYLNKPDATREAFDADGWFATGDIVRVDGDGDFRIVGRASVDVLKCAGYKISALEVERDIAAHERVEEVAVVGVEDDEYGQIVAAVVAIKPGKGEFGGKELQEWCKERMSREKVPRLVRVVDQIPRNAMGKVNKKELVKIFSTEKQPS